MNVHGLKCIRTMIALQSLLMLSLALLMLKILGAQDALSAVLGGVCAIVPGAVFAIRHFQHHGAAASRQILKGFYMAEVLKILTSIVLITMTLLVFHVKPFGFLTTYILTIMTAWFAPLVLYTK